MWSLTVTGALSIATNLRELCMSKRSCSYVIIFLWNNIQKRLLLSLFSWQMRLLRVCTIARARPSLRHSTKISCAGSNGDLCTVYVSSECCGESAPAASVLPWSLKIMHSSPRLPATNFLVSLKVFAFAPQIPKNSSASLQIPKNISQFSLKCIYLSVG